MEQYIDIFDFQLNDMEMLLIDAFYTEERLTTLEAELGPKQFPIGLSHGRAVKTNVER